MKNCITCGLPISAEMEAGAVEYAPDEHIHQSCHSVEILVTRYDDTIVSVMVPEKSLPEQRFECIRRKLGHTSYKHWNFAHRGEASKTKAKDFVTTKLDGRPVDCVPNTALHRVLMNQFNINKEEADEVIELAFQEQAKMNAEFHGGIFPDAEKVSS